MRACSLFDARIVRAFDVVGEPVGLISSTSLPPKRAFFRSVSDFTSNFFDLFQAKPDRIR